MQIFVASKGQRLGPFSIYLLTEMIREGEVSPNDLGWYQGRDEWTPLSEIPALMSVIEAKREGDLLHESGKPLGTTDTTDDGDIDRDSSSDRINPIDPAPGAPSASPPPAVTVDQRSTSADASALSKARPVSRFWARMFDYLLVTLVVYALFGPMPIPAEFSNNPLPSSAVIIEIWKSHVQSPEVIRLASIQHGALVLWVLLESFLLHRFGTTPGKALFGIRVTQADGSPLGLQQSMLRAFFVWFAGMGMSLWLFPLIALSFSLWSVLSRGSTIWDRQLSTVARQKPLGGGRIVLAFAAFFTIMMALRLFSVSA